MQINGVTISEGNDKLGNIPNISLVPVFACPHGVPCASSCYAVKFFMMYPGVRGAWSQNTRIAMDEPDRFFGAVRIYLGTGNMKWFRVHVAGDFLDQGYLDRWIRLAQSFPTTTFVAFTKQYYLDYQEAPDNLRVRYSMWPGLPFDERRVTRVYPKAWVVGAPAPGPVTVTGGAEQVREWRIPRGARKCPGSCITCKSCWTSRSDVVFKRH